MSKVKYEIYFNGENHIHVIDGNKKLGKGVFNISLLPSDKPLKLKSGVQLTNLKGTCGGCCESCKNNCYAVNSCVCHHNSVIPAWGENTLLARENMEEFFRQLEIYFNDNIISVFRWHVGGEFFSKEYMKAVYEFCAKHSETRFYAYTKRFDWLEELNEFKPSNLIINVSIWHKNYSNPLNYPEFIYDDGTEKELENVPHCPAVDKSGHETGVTCSKCRRCFKAKNGDKIAVYAH